MQRGEQAWSGWYLTDCWVLTGICCAASFSTPVHFVPAISSYRLREREWERERYSICPLLLLCPKQSRWYGNSKEIISSQGIYSDHSRREMERLTAGPGVGGSQEQSLSVTGVLSLCTIGYVCSVWRSRQLQLHVTPRLFDSKHTVLCRQTELELDR